MQSSLICIMHVGIFDLGQLFWSSCVILNMLKLPSDLKQNDVSLPPLPKKPIPLPI